MKKKSTSQSAFFSLRVLIGLFVVLAGVFLALLGFGAFSAQAQQNYTPTMSMDTLVPVGFDCSRIHELGIDKQENMRAGAIMIACGEAQGGSTSRDRAFSQLVQSLTAPLTFGATDMDLVTGTETYPNVTQSETFCAVNPDNSNQIVVAFNDSRGRNVSPINISGASVSTDGGTTFTRLTTGSGQGPFSNTVGDPVILYKRNNGTWYTVWLDDGCGGQGLGGYKSTTPSDANSWTHFCVHTGTSDDRESGWVDNNLSSPHYGRMYVSWNDFARNDAIFVRYSDDGVTWTETGPLPGTGSSPFIRDVQSTGDLVTGDVYVAGMNEGGGAFNGPRNNLIFRSTDGGASWINTYIGPTFNGPGRAQNGYFACMYTNPAPGYWRHEGWGQVAAINHVVHYDYAVHGAGSDAGNVFYIRSADSGATFSAPLQLNTDGGTGAQWEPNLSVSPSGTVFAVWYDERNGGSCTAGSNTPCYQMFARKSTDNGVTWLSDMALSDVVSPLPAQPDPGIVASYVGDYDYQIGVATSHRTAWVDGRNAISGAYQQDAFTDREQVSATATPTPTATVPPSPTPTPTATSTPTPTPTPTPGAITLTASGHKVHGFDTVDLSWIGATSSMVDIYRNGVVIATVPSAPGSYTDNTGQKGRATFTYQVCEQGTQNCSNQVTVRF